MMNADEQREMDEKVRHCAKALASTMLRSSDDPRIGLLAAVFVAAGGARASGLDKATALHMFEAFYDDATDFMGELDDNKH
jgi:di/tricarboxylate transporter